MEKKNMVLLTVIAVATLLVAVVGATFAYFSTTSSNQFNGEGTQGNTSVGSGNVTGDAIGIAARAPDAGSFTATDVYPGHKDTAGIHVNAKSSASVSSKIKITYDVTENTFGADSIKVSLYKSSQNTTLSDDWFGCTKVSEGVGDEIHYYENCTKTVPTDLTGATLVGSEQTLTGRAQTITLSASETLTSSPAGVDTYYFVVVEFVNKGSDQTTADADKTLTGDIKIDVI